MLVQDPQSAPEEYKIPNPASGGGANPNEEVQHSANSVSCSFRQVKAYRWYPVSVTERAPRKFIFD